MKRRALAVIAASLAFAAAPDVRALGPKDGGAKNVAILLFPGVQIIDYTGPWEVLGHAIVDGKKAFRIYSVAETATPLETAMGMTVIPSFTLDRAPKPDILVVPGGNVDTAIESAAVIRWVKASAGSADVVLSVCNGAFILAKAGLLDGLEATTFAGMIDDLKEAAPKTKVVRDKRFVDNGKVVTAAGLSSGIDGALHVIEKLYGKGTAQVAAVGMEYDWRPDSGWARASLADRHLSPAYEAMRQYPSTVVRHEGTRDRWETAWKIETPSSREAVLAAMDSAFQSAGGWTRQGAGWRRSGPDGAWIEAARIEALPGAGKGYLLTLTVSRAS